MTDSEPIKMTDSEKRYTYSILKEMNDGDEFMSGDCRIDWNIFISISKIIMDKKVLWDSGADFHIVKNGSGIKCIKTN